jgi:hypothetical protein
MTEMRGHQRPSITTYKLLQTTTVDTFSVSSADSGPAPYWRVRGHSTMQTAQGVHFRLAQPRPARTWDRTRAHTRTGNMDTMDTSMHAQEALRLSTTLMQHIQPRSALRHLHIRAHRASSPPSPSPIFTRTRRASSPSLRPYSSALPHHLPWKHLL